MSENTVRVTASAKVRPSASPVETLSGKNSEIGAADKKMEENSHALGTEGAQIVRIGNIPSLDPF